MERTKHARLRDSEQQGFGADFSWDQKLKVLKSIYKKKSFLIDEFISCSTTQVENVLESTGKVE